VCPVRAIHAYVDFLRSKKGNVGPDAPFFQVFCVKEDKFDVTKLAYIVNKALSALGAKQPGQSVHFRVQVANMLIQAGIPKELHNRFMDWKDKIYQAQHSQAATYARGLDPQLATIQEQVYIHFAKFSSI
jgi:hypothetical protein